MKAPNVAYRPPLMTPSIVLLGIVALISATPAHASPELARARLCLGCHGVAEKQVGPSFRDIAARYAGQPGAAAQLTESIRHGGVGRWGPVPMPANPKLTADEASRLANWVLTMR